MPRTKKTIQTDTYSSTPSYPLTPAQTPSWKKPHVIGLVVLLIGLIVLFATNKGLLVAAVVNGKPIFRWDLNKVLVSRFGKQSLEGMISESLIAEAAKKEGVTISSADVDNKINEIVKGLGANVSLDDLLTYQGMSKSDFQNQVKLQLTVQRVLGKDITITEGDINNYIATSSALLTATDPAQLRKEAQTAIMDAKIGEKLQGWFASLQQNAKIMRFL